MLVQGPDFIVQEAGLVTFFMNEALIAKGLFGYDLMMTAMCGHPDLSILIASNGCHVVVREPLIDFRI